MDQNLFYKAYPNEEHFREMILEYTNFQCTYCQNKMIITSVPTKRRTPPGAKDLGIYDEVICWQCPRCNGTSTNSIERCRCGKPIFFIENYDSIVYSVDANCCSTKVPQLFSQLMVIQNYDVEEDAFFERNRCRCISCINCKLCGKPLESEGKNLFVSHRYTKLEDYITQAEHTYYHKRCLEEKLPARAQETERATRRAKKTERENEQRRWLRENLARIPRRIGKAILCAIVAFVIVGFIGWGIREGPPSYTYNPNYGKGTPALDAFSAEAVYVSLSIIGIALVWSLVNLFKSNLAVRLLLFILGIATLSYVGKATLDSLNVRDKLARIFNVSTGVPAGGSRETPQATAVIQADKITKGRSRDENVYEFALPPNQWVETSLKVTPYQEVRVHHFSSNEVVKVNLGGVTDTRLQKAGTILPLYTSTNCADSHRVKRNDALYCVQLDKAEGIKLYSSKSVRVGVAIKNLQ